MIARDLTHDSVPILGPRLAEQLSDKLAALQVKLTPEQIIRLNIVSELERLKPSLLAYQVWWITLRSNSPYAFFSNKNRIDCTRVHQRLHPTRQRLLACTHQRCNACQHHTGNNQTQTGGKHGRE